MASLNKVLLIGNLTRDPELRFTPGGRPVCDLRMAVSRRFKRANGEDGEETCYISVVVWDKQGENCGKYLKKGSPAFVEGRLQLDEWEKDGKKSSQIRVLAERVQFMGSPSGQGGATRPPPPPVETGKREADDTPIGPSGGDGPGGENGPAGDDDNLPF